MCSFIQEVHYFITESVTAGGDDNGRNNKQRKSKSYHVFHIFPQLYHSRKNREEESGKQKCNHICCIKQPVSRGINPRFMCSDFKRKHPFEHNSVSCTVKSHEHYENRIRI